MKENSAKRNEASDEWTMPETVFRTSEGFTPKKRSAEKDVSWDIEDDFKTEPMEFVTARKEKSPNASVETESKEEKVETPSRQSVRVKEKSRRRHRKKKLRKSKVMRALALIVGLLIGSAILAVIYFIFR